MVKSTEESRKLYDTYMKLLMKLDEHHLIMAALVVMRSPDGHKAEEWKRAVFDAMNNRVSMQIEKLS